MPAGVRDSHPTSPFSPHPHRVQLPSTLFLTHTSVPASSPLPLSSPKGRSLQQARHSWRDLLPDPETVPLWVARCCPPSTSLSQQPPPPSPPLSATRLPPPCTKHQAPPPRPQPLVTINT
ncbi:hypothetical protein E2C01_061757 [Portunus trituberculatus]|uniref:Uncharacterized protein n=1 Tax=Portunus trituberculatus TaxID=210409 RepID=A0A5B7H4P9_PORTR|nr:hypothetical protein [Portunus trituberculatus]